MSETHYQRDNGSHSSIQSAPSQHVEAFVTTLDSTLGLSISSRSIAEATRVEIERCVLVSRYLKDGTAGNLHASAERINKHNLAVKFRKLTVSVVGLGAIALALAGSKLGLIDASMASWVFTFTTGASIRGLSEKALPVNVKSEFSPELRTAMDEYQKIDAQLRGLKLEPGSPSFESRRQALLDDKASEYLDRSRSLLAAAEELAE